MAQMLDLADKDYFFFKAMINMLKGYNENGGSMHYLLGNISRDMGTIRKNQMEMV